MTKTIEFTNRRSMISTHLQADMVNAVFMLLRSKKKRKKEKKEKRILVLSSSFFAVFVPGNLHSHQRLGRYKTLKPESNQSYHTPSTTLPPGLCSATRAPNISRENIVTYLEFCHSQHWDLRSGWRWCVSRTLRGRYLE